MSEKACEHPDIREFDGLSCCFACGETVFDDSVLVPTNQIVDTEDHYRYISLNYNRGLEIRLIELLPGEEADPIRCEIIHVNLEDSPNYDAVSYTWATESGDDSLCKTIQVLPGGSMLVTANCDVALRQLRRRGLRRRLWIDAICIDQTKVKERNHQVNLMDRIYSFASSVRICVQDPTARSSGWDYSALFQWFGQTQAHDTEVSSDNNNLPPGDRRVPRKLPLYGHVAPTLQLLSRRYFKRIWVIQEVVLARAAYLALNDEELLLTSKVLDSLISIWRQLKRPPPSVLGWRSTQDTTASILFCLYASMHCEMTDPRDGIYAVLSLMEPRSRSLISVNYASTVESVYANAVAAIISTHQDLKILSYVGVDTLISPEGNTSSSPVTSVGGWQTAMCLDMARLRLFVFDSTKSTSFDPLPRATPTPLPSQFGTHSIGPWRPTVHIEVAPPEVYHERITSGGSHSCIVELPRPTHTDYLPRIFIRAHYIDNVDVPAVRFPDEGDIMTIAHQASDDPQNLTKAELAWILPLLGGRSSKRSGWWITNEFTNEPELTQEFMDRVESGQTLATEANLYISEPNLAAIWNFFHEIVGLQFSSHCFSGHFSFGFAQVAIQTGDEIFVVDGMRTPLILRRTGHNQYRIVCECWFWAALELDCWNPGTKKGKWGEDVERPTVTQTRMIEIH